MKYNPLKTQLTLICPFKFHQMSYMTSYRYFIQTLIVWCTIYRRHNSLKGYNLVFHLYKLIEGQYDHKVNWKFGLLETQRLFVTVMDMSRPQVIFLTFIEGFTTTFLHAHSWLKLGIETTRSTERSYMTLYMCFTQTLVTSCTISEILA